MLKIRADKESGCLRSVGDPPHGIVGFTMRLGDELCFHVDPAFEPGGKKPGPDINFYSEDDELDVAFVDVVELVEACEGQLELGVVWQMIEEVTTEAIPVFTKRGRFDAIRGHVDTLEATCRAIADRLQEEGVGG